MSYPHAEEALAGFFEECRLALFAIRRQFPVLSQPGDHAATLGEVLDHYSAGGRHVATGPHAGNGAHNPHKSMFITGFALNARERADLVAFLESLTDRQFLSNPAHGDPSGASGISQRTRDVPGR